MNNSKSKQGLANLIQCYEQAVNSSQSLYKDESMQIWAVSHSLEIKAKIKDVKEKLKEIFDIDYDSEDANKEVIKEGSEVSVLANHMEGMKGGTAKIKSYSLPANLSNVTMTDGTEMKNHKWMTNNEVELK